MKKVKILEKKLTTYNYDVGQDKSEFKSIFTVFPHSYLNVTDTTNAILNRTDIPLHSELNDTLSPITTDFLLFYRLPKKVVQFPFNLQNSAIVVDDGLEHFTKNDSNVKLCSLARTL